MKHQKLLFAAVVIAFGAISYLSSCSEDNVDLPLEPIHIIAPDTSIIRKFPGDSVPYEVQFITDRPINWVKGMFEVDSSQDPNHVYTFPDTLFFLPIDTLDPRVNIYTYTGVFFVPGDSVITPFDKIRFKVSFEAGKATFSTGQNYPKGIVTASKEFRIDVR